MFNVVAGTHELMQRSWGNWKSRERERERETNLNLREGAGGETTRSSRLLSSREPGTSRSKDSR